VVENKLKAREDKIMGKGTAFGKTILIGDQFVLEEVPAIVSAIPFETLCEVQRLEEGEGWVLEDNRTEVPGYKEKKKHQQVDSINHMLEVMKIDVKNHPIKITYGGSLLAGSGVGASAAHCVSLARALNEEFKLGLSIDEINHFGWEGEFAYHGTPSGVDNTASTYGGLILYHIKNGEKTWNRINLKEPVEVVLGNSGVTADTSKLDAHVQAQREKDSNLFKERLQTVTDQAFEMKKALENSDLVAVGKIMTDNHKILIDMDLSHETLIYLCNKALELGALGAKVTGGGRGGYMNALTPGKDLQEKVASKMENEGFKVIRATIGERSHT
jgi:mevalonate kinase